jgi:hypothetical protein
MGGGAKMELVRKGGATVGGGAKARGRGQERGGAMVGGGVTVRGGARSPEVQGHPSPPEIRSPFCLHLPRAEDTGAATTLGQSPSFIKSHPHPSQISLPLQPILTFPHQ